MYITINNIKGEKRIDLSYSIQNCDSGKECLGACSAEIPVIRMLSNNIKYEILKLRAVMDPISNVKKMIPSGTYAGRELISMLEGIVELNQFEVDDQVIKKNKLKGITEIAPASSTSIRSLSPGDQVSEVNEHLPENELQMAAITFMQHGMHWHHSSKTT